MLLNIQVRPFKISDFPFIVSSWAKSYKMMSYFAKRVNHETFFVHHPQIISGILDLPMTKVHVAVSPDDPDQIIGYCVASAVRAPDEDKQAVVLHYIFVKKEFQKVGVGKRLVSELNIRDGDEVSFTHWTYPVDELTKKYPTWVYNPYLV